MPALGQPREGNYPKPTYPVRRVVLLEPWRAALLDELAKPANERRADLAHLPEFPSLRAKGSISAVLRHATDALFLALEIRDIGDNSNISKVV